MFDGFGYHSINENVGDEMMDLIKTMAISPDNDCAARYLVVDAVNHPNVINYYKRNGFDFLFESDEEEMKCLRSDRTNKTIIRKVLEFCRLVKQQEKPACKTRLMLFDLILLKQ